MDAIELFHQDGKSAGIYYCEKCRLVYNGKHQAAQCCAPVVCECGTEIEDRYYRQCRKCRHVAHLKRERELFEKAEKLTEWNGPVLLPDSDRYYASIQDYMDDAFDGEVPQHEYVWACDSRPICVLDLYRIIENATDDAPEEFDPDDLEGRTDLEAAIDRFNDLNKGVVMWESDHKTAVVLATKPTADTAGTEGE